MSDEKKCVGKDKCPDVIESKKAYAFLYRLTNIVFQTCVKMLKPDPKVAEMVDDVDDLKEDEFK